MKYSSVIVTYNRKEKLSEALFSLFNQTIRPVRITLVDNNSTDGTEEYLKEKGFLDNPLLDYMKLPENIGGSGGFHEGIKRALEFEDIDYVAISDDDAIYATDFFEKIDYAQNKYDNYKAFCGSVKDLNGNLQTSHRRIIVDDKKVKEVVISSEKYNVDFDIDTFSFVGCVISIDILRQIGLPNRDYFIYYDDTEYSMRVRKLTPIKNVVDAIINHKVVENFDFSLNWKTYYGVRNELDMRLSHTNWNLIRPFLFLRMMKKYCDILYDSSYKGNRLKAFKIYHAGYRDGVRGILGKNPKYLPGMKL